MYLVIYCKAPGNCCEMCVLYKHAHLINTIKGLYFLHCTNGACAIIYLDPDHQPVLGASSHLVEKLQTLKRPLGVEGSGFQQSRLVRHPSHGVEVHEVPSI